MRDQKATVAEPVVQQKSIRSEMSDLARRATGHRLFPDVIHPIQSVDKRDGAPVGGPKEIRFRIDRQRKNLGGLAALERNHRELSRLVFDWEIIAGNPFSIRGHRWIC